MLTLAEQPPRLLLPGGITLEQLKSVLGRVEMDDAVLHPLADGKRAASVSYTHLDVYKRQHLRRSAIFASASVFRK